LTKKNIYYIIIPENKKKEVVKMTVNRGSLKRMAKKGELLAAKDGLWLPVRLVPNGGHRDVLDGEVGIQEWEFSSKCGGAWRNSDGSISLMVHDYKIYLLKEKGEYK